MTQCGWLNAWAEVVTTRTAALIALRHSDRP